MLKLNARETACAIGAAGTMAGGLVASFGTHAKPFHAGMAAMDGIHAAMLAANSFEAATGLHELDKGALDAIIQMKPADLAVPTLEFEHWEILANGYKPYACCRATHASAQAARTLIDKVGVGRRSVA